MKPILWFVLGLVVAMSGQAFAQYVNQYGNSLDYTRGVGPSATQPNSYGSNGTVSPAPVLPSYRSPC